MAAPNPFFTGQPAPSAPPPNAFFAARPAPSAPPAPSNPFTFGAGQPAAPTSFPSFQFAGANSQLPSNAASAWPQTGQLAATFGTAHPSLAPPSDANTFLYSRDRLQNLQQEQQRLANLTSQPNGTNPGWNLNGTTWSPLAGPLLRQAGAAADLAQPVYGVPSVREQWQELRATQDMLSRFASLPVEDQHRLIHSQRQGDPSAVATTWAATGLSGSMRDWILVISAQRASLVEQLVSLTCQRVRI